MRFVFPILLSLVFVMTSCQNATPISKTRLPSSPTADTLELAWEDLSIFLPGVVPTYHAFVTEMTRASVYHLQFDIDPDLIHIKGIEEVRYVNNEHVPLNDIHFRLFPNILGGDMHVSQVLENSQPIAPDYQLDNSLMIVPLTRPLEPGQELILTLEFMLRVPETVELNYGVLASAEGVLALAHAYPMLPVFNEEGWNDELPPSFGDLTFSDMSFFLVKVTAPKDLTLVGVGRELSHTEIGQTQVVHYAAGPVRDFYLAASPAYTLKSEQVGGIRVNFYTPSYARNGAREGIRVAFRAVEVFNKRYVPYPYTELDIVATPTAALGIEYPGMIAITDRIITPGEILFESTIVHEVGHQWFYNLIGSDQLNDPWLDESLTQYLTMQYFTDEYGDSGASGFRQSLEERWDRVDSRPIPIGLPVKSYSGQEYGAIVYGRGPLFLEALKQKMGSEVFDDFMRGYARSYSWDISTPEAFKSLAESYCACDLTYLFDQWVLP